MLLLDDEKVICEIGKRLFEKRGFKVHAVLTVKEALSKIDQYQYDIALLDQHLERGSGLDVLKVLREKQPQCQCIMLTVEDDQAIIAQAKAMGAVDYLIKPLQIKDIDKAINKVAKRIKKERGNNG